MKHIRKVKQMDRTEIIERLKNIAEHAVHTVGERPFIMSLDDGIAVHEAIELLKKAETNCPEIPDSCNVETVEAIPLDWIRTYISNLKAMGVQLSLRDAQAVSVMVDKYMMEQNGNATCGPDYCEIG